MLKKVIILTLLLQGAVAFGQSTVAVQLPASGDYAVFTSHGLPTEPPATPTASKGGATPLIVPSGDDTVTVWDKASGNLGSKPVSKIKSGWTVANSDFDHIAQVQVNVEHDGNPVAAGAVSLDDGTKRDDEILDSKSAGTVTFFDVKPGRVIATVKVKSDKGGSQTVAQVLQCPLTRDKTVPEFPIAIAQAVDTVPVAGAAKPGTSAAPGAGAAKTPTTDNNPNVIGTVITYIVALGIGAGVLYAIYSYLKKAPGTVSDKLEQLGVQIPKPDDQDTYGGTPTPITIPKPEPVQKIMLDDAAPIPLSSTATVPSSAIDLGSVASEPSLVNSAGIALPLFDGETVVGRDPGLGLSLTGETTVSRNHATLVRRGNEVTVTDNGSTNGTFVNGARLQAPTTLRPGDSVQFGSVAFRYQG